MTTMIRRLRHVLLWCLSAAAVLAGGDGRARVFEAARLAPADVDALIAVQDAAAIRRGEMGPAATAMIERALGEGDTARAWSALAARLGWSREEAFDRLLGSRVALIVRGTAGDAPAWALVSEVSLDTEKRLRERLDVAPRAIVAGHTVLSVERGAYELSAERRARHATLILAPAARNALFDELVPLLAKGPAQALLNAPEFAEIAALGGGDILVFARSPEGGGAWAGAVARREGMRLVTNLVAAPRDTDQEIGAIEPWDASAAQAAGRNALFWTIERSLPAAFGASGLSTVVSGLPVLRLRERAADTLGDYLGLWVAPSAEGLPGVAAALEIQDLHDAPARADGLMSELLSTVGLDGLDFAGVEPRATRTVDLNASAVIRDSGLWEEGPVARWRFAKTGEGAPAKGWWIMALGAEAFDLAERSLGAPDIAPPGARRAWVGVGGARPAEALGALKRAGIDAGGPLLAASLVREVRWSIEVVPGLDKRPRLRGWMEASIDDPHGAPGPGERERGVKD
ncbi:MAG: hypothetical protein IBJ10_00320 [Phycisphaerales bacterium]|nr:hypothetical protein [Phycisphaerales bacterium]